MRPYGEGYIQKLLNCKTGGVRIPELRRLDDVKKGARSDWN